MLDPKARAMAARFLCQVHTGWRTFRFAPRALPSRAFQNPVSRPSSTHLPFFSALAKTVSILLKSNLPSSGLTSAHEVRKVSPDVFGLLYAFRVGLLVSKSRPTRFGSPRRTRCAAPAGARSPMDCRPGGGHDRRDAFPGGPQPQEMVRDQRRHLLERRRPREGGRRRLVHDARRRGARPRRRIGLGQDHGRPHHPAPHRPDARAASSSRASDIAASRASGAAAVPPARAADLPGPLRLAQSAHARRGDRRRAADRPRHRRAAARERRERVAEILRLVGLPTER